MTRRHYHSKKKRRVRSNSGNQCNDACGNNNYSSSSTTSMEEDLRQQRIRQQEREWKMKQRQQEEDIQKEEQYRLQLEERLREKELQETWNIPATPERLIFKGVNAALKKGSSAVSLPVSFTLSHVQQSSCLLAGHQRRQLGYLWHSKYLLDNLWINSRAFLLYSKKYKWANRTLPDGSHSSWDLSCKDRLHPSSRTFDVATFQRPQEKLPTIVSIVEEGWSVFHDNQMETVQVQRSAPLNVIRLHENTRRIGVITNQPSAIRPTEQFLLYSLTGHIKRLLFSTNLSDIPINDFCFGKDLILFAGPRQYKGRKIRPLFIPLSPEGGNLYGARELDVHNFPESDAIRVELTCKHDSIIGFGHRNGQVSLLDLRESTSVCSILQCEESSLSPSAASTLGSATDLSFLSSSNSQKLLVRRSHGSCQLHDLRVASSIEKHNPHLSSSPTLLWNMTVPPDDINGSLTTRCNGFAVDPNGTQTLISPFISPNNDAHLGVWSLNTGMMVGSRVLKSCTNMDDTLYVELSQKTTPSFVNDRRNENVTCSLSSFSVWAKCGAHSKQEVSSKVGTLHQVSFPGHWK
jgi:hypothetical protein